MLGIAKLIPPPPPPGGSCQLLGSILDLLAPA
jgi:hypothetical protein